MDTLDEEILVVESIYCGNNEFKWIPVQSDMRKFQITVPYYIPDEDCDTNLDKIMQVVFTLDAKSQEKFPSILILKPVLNNQKYNELLEALKLSIGGDSLLEIITWLINNMAMFKPTNNKINEISPEDNNFTCVIQLDHMRSKLKYEKVLKAWTKDLCLRTGVLFYNKLIFIVCQGAQNSVKMFLTNLKSQNVDVDSNGKPCKEKLSKTLFHGKFIGDVKCVFESCRFDTADNLKDYFQKLGIISVYENEIKMLVHLCSIVS